MSGETADERPEYLSSVQAKTVGGNFSQPVRTGGSCIFVTFEKILKSVMIEAIGTR